MTDHSAKEIVVYLRQCLLPGDVQDGIDLEIPSWLVRDAAEAMDKLAALEQRLEELEEMIAPPANEDQANGRIIMALTEYRTFYQKALAQQEEA